MNREIKFRGRIADTREWLYGSLLILTTGHYIVPAGTYYNEITDFDIDEKITVNALWEHNDFYQVIPETVGQYTGLKDRKGKDIYEGDIIQYTFDSPESLYATENGLKVRKSKVFWSEWRGSFAVGNSLANNNLFNYVRNGNRVEVIGNIHENPELLEVQNE